MAREGFNTPPSLGQGQAPLEIGESVRAWLKATDAVLVAVFNWIGERQERAYERRLLASLGSRARSDLGLGPATELDETISDWWAKR